MQTEWDDDKNQGNLRKHGVSFDEAATALDDPLSVTVADVFHSDTEDRSLTVGLSARGRLLVVVVTEHGETTRIISARLATAFERRTYEDEDT